MAAAAMASGSLSMVPAASAAAQNPASAAPDTLASNANTAADIPAALRRVLQHPSLRGARVGLLVTDAETGVPLLRQRADELFAPASVAKLFTTATALWKLGPHFVWRTPLAYSGTLVGGALEGDLWALGRGAPDLVEEKLWVTAQGLRELGIERISGDLVVDDRYFDAERYGQGWPGGIQVREAYHAPISGLMVNFAARRGANGWESVDDPARHFGERLHDLLNLAGVIVEGIVREPTDEEKVRIAAPELTGTNLGSASVPVGLTHLYTIASEPLGRVVMDVNKFSNNVMAESLLKALGATEHGAPGTVDKGLSVVNQFTSEVLGFDPTSYTQADGSGLSRLARFSPGQISALLSHAYHDFHVGPELVASMKIGGLDGWNPAAFKREPIVGELRLKTGHINGVNTLAGYLHTDGDRVITLVAMINDHRVGQWEIDQRMAEIVAFLLENY